MKKRLFLLLLIANSIFPSLFSQYVTIPDSSFRAFLIQQYPTCFDTQQKMDTSCLYIRAAISLDCSYKNIYSVEGLQYFRSLQYFFCNYNHVESLPPLTDSMRYLYCNSNQIQSLPPLPPNLLWLHCSNNALTNLPVLPPHLTHLLCRQNNLTTLPALPSTLHTFNCSFNQLASLPSLPSSLEKLFCSDNNLQSLPVLPNSLSVLDCSNNTLTSLPTIFPTAIAEIKCYNNQIEEISIIPYTLYSLTCRDNPLFCLPSIPTTLGSDEASLTANTNITCLPNYTGVITASNAVLPLCTTNCGTFLGIEENNLSFSLQPNPTQGDTKIIMKEANSYQTTIYDALGKQLLHQYTEGIQWTIPTATLPTGIYGVSITDGHSSFHRKLIKW